MWELSRMGRRVAGLLALCTILALALPLGTGAQEDQDDAVFQVSTINALMQGIYDGEMTLGELARGGDFGLGTLNGLDGEMVVLDGRVYQVRSDGVAYPTEAAGRTPFAVVKLFTPDTSAPVREGLSETQLEQRIDGLAANGNALYAIRVRGSFAQVKVRSVPRQTPPYRPLVEAVKGQTVFELSNVKGTLVGFRFPGYLAGLNVPGYHLHFLTEDCRAGGHVLSCRMAEGTIEVDESHEFRMALPRDAAFGAADLTTANPAGLQQVEKGGK